MRGQNPPHPLSNILIGVETSTLSSWGIKNRTPPPEQYVDWGNSINFIFMRDQKSHPPEQYVDWGNSINFIFMRDQKSHPPLNNMLIGVITSTLSSWGITFATLSEQYVDWGKKKQQLYLHEGSKIAPPSEQYVDWGNNINFIFMRDHICHPLWTICWLG